MYTETVPFSSVQFHFLIHLSPDEAGFLQARGILDLHLHIQLCLRLTGELSFLLGEKIDRGLASLRSPIRF